VLIETKNLTSKEKKLMLYDDHTKVVYATNGRPLDVNAVRQRKAELKGKAEKLINAAIAAGRDLSSAEQKLYDAHVEEVKTLDAQLDQHAKGAFLVHAEHAKQTGPEAFGRTSDNQLVPIFGKGQSLAAYAKQTHSDQDVSFGELIRAMVLGGGSPAVRAALSIGTDSAGGVSVPHVLSTELIDALRARSVMFQAGARTIPLQGGKDTTIVRIDSDPVATWRPENSPVATSDMTFSGVTFTPKTLAVIVTASRELVEDSVNLGPALQLSFAKAFASELDRVALIGSGTGSEPKGVSQTAGVGSFSMGTNGAAPASYSPFVEALGILQTANANDPTAVIIAPRTNKELNLLVDTLGQPMRKPDAIANLPFLVTSKLPITETQGTSNNASRAVMGYFPDVLVGVRTELRIEVIRDLYEGNLQFGFLGYLRADVAVAHPANFCNVVGIL
jgi:HK97 family phage major capsid protein